MKFKFHLSNEEAEVLHKALAIYTSDFRNEIARTDDLNYRKSLEVEYDTLKSIEDRLKGYIGHEAMESDESERIEQKKAG
jgi:hypothetical protein